jgi:hypothetical protein
MRDWDDKEAVPGIRNTSKGVIPSEERGKEAEVASTLDAGFVYPRVISIEIPNTEQEERQIEGKEEHEEGDCRLERAEKEDGGENEPALNKMLAQEIVVQHQELTINRKPKEFVKPRGPFAASIELTISKPPGVRTMATEIQKPP